MASAVSAAPVSAPTSSRSGSTVWSSTCSREPSQRSGGGGAWTTGIWPMLALRRSARPTCAVPAAAVLDPHGRRRGRLRLGGGGVLRLLDPESLRELAGLEHLGDD